MKFAAASLLALAAVAKATVVPSVVTSIATLDSSATSLTLGLAVTVSYGPEDSNTTVPFTFGSTDGLQFGNGVFTVPVTDVAVTSSVSATATWAPADDAAKAAAVNVLSAFTSNNASSIAVTNANDNTTYTVTVNGVGVDIIQTLYVHVTTATVTTHQSTSFIQTFNPFTVPLGFVGISASATDFGLASQPVVGTISQPDLAASGLAFTVAPGAVVNSTTLPAVTNLNLATIVQLLRQFAGGATVPLYVNANAVISIGNYVTPVNVAKTVGAKLV
ncbi:hypothetical protein DFJ73DRAFT_765095 [Zopfochytrium polystomum]|nr:hypothetical protein DFJ73DRAFT_765095 [Zopfochytrium polystomum]